MKKIMLTFLIQSAIAVTLMNIPTPYANSINANNCEAFIDKVAPWVGSENIAACFSSCGNRSQDYILDPFRFKSDSRKLYHQSCGVQSTRTFLGDMERALGPSSPWSLRWQLRKSNIELRPPEANLFGPEA